MSDRPDTDSSPAPGDSADHNIDPAPDDERERLVSAAEQVLSRSGWWGFKVESVLRQAKLSTRSFYRHFDTKSDLFLAVFDRQHATAVERIRRITLSQNSGWDGVRAYISDMIGIAYGPVAGPSSLFFTHWRALVTEYPDEFQALQADLIAPLVEAIERGVRTGELSSPNPLDDAHAIFALVFTVTADQATIGIYPTREELTRICLPLIASALGVADAYQPDASSHTDAS